MIWEREIVQSEARQLADRYELNYKRVLAVAETVEEFRQSRESSIKNPYHLRWRPSLSCLGLDVALRYGNPDAILDLFERERIDDIARRSVFVSYIADEDTPLYSLPELSLLSEKFSDYLLSNKPALVSFGFPTTSFVRSFWLATRLAQNYFAECPIGVDPVGFRHGKPGYVFAVQTDLRVPDDLGRGHNIRCVVPAEAFMTNDYVVLEDCTVCRVLPTGSRQPLVVCISDSEASRLEELREKVADTKAQVLRAAAYALCDRDAEQLWRRSLRILTKTLTKPDVDFLLQLDAAYTGYNLLSNTLAPGDESIMLPPGGLTDLLMMIGHIEKEIRIGTYDRCRELLAEIVNPDLTSPSRLTANSYFSLAERPENHLIDHAVAEFARLEKREEFFWDEFSRRVTVAVRGEFVHPHTVTVMVPAKTETEFKLRISSIVDAIETSLNSAGAMPQLVSSIVDITSQVSPSRNLFRRMGEFYHVQFARQTAFFADSVGMRYLEVLLMSPGTGLSAAELEDRTRPIHAGGDSLATSMSAAQLEEDLLTVRSIRDYIYEDHDREGFRLALETLKDLEEQLAEAIEDELPQDSIRKLREQQERCASYIRTEFGLRGTRRNKELDKIRSRVTKAITEAIARIDREHKPLAQHLRSCVNTGSLCIYAPCDSVSWLTE